VGQREQQRLETRRLLAEHALRLFRDDGFEETTVEAIAAAAGVSARTFFLHFSTKAAAAFPDHEERVASFVERLTAGAPHRDPIAHLREVMLTGVDYESPMRRTRYRLLASVPALRDEDARTDRDYEDAMSSYLLAHWGETEETRLRAHAVANAMTGVVRAVLISSSEDGIDARSACAEILQRMFGSPLGHPLHSLQQS